MPTASRSSLLSALALVVGGGLLLGAATSLLQTVLPPALNSFANSSGGWSMLVFALVRLARVRPVAGAVLGLLSFLAMLEGYDLVTGWRGFGWSPPFSDPFWLLAVPAGPILGAAAALTLHGTTAWRVLAVAPLSGVLIGEGVWALSAVADTTSPVYWWLEIVLGVAFLGLAILRRRPGLPVVLASLAVTAAAAVCFDVVYSLF